VYTVADRCSRRVRWTVAMFVAAGVVVSQLSPGHNEPYDGIEAALIMATAWLAGTLSRARRRYLNEVEGRAVAAEAAAAEERSRMARELHDVVAHHVSVVAVQAEAALSLLPQHPAESARSVEIIASTARQAMTELRQLLGVLRRRAETVPLETSPTASLDSIRDLVDRARGAGLPVTVEVVGERCPLGATVEAHAYRIVQEALTNALRHSHGGSAAVALTYEPGYLTVSVTDSGGRASPLAAPPLPPAAGNGNGGTGASPAGTGFGLAGIAERVASCGGSLTVGPKGRGFAIVARLPAH
jgi:signal transduction histidine kinase